MKLRQNKAGTYFLGDEAVATETGRKLRVAITGRVPLTLICIEDSKHPECGGDYLRLRKQVLEKCKQFRAGLDFDIEL